MSDKWEIYKDPNGEWRWQCTAPNGEIVGASTESYHNHLDCLENAERFGYHPVDVKIKAGASFALPAGASSLWQIHHEFKDHTTEMCAQREIRTHEDAKRFMDETMVSHPLPEGAQYLVVGEYSPLFWKVPA